MSEVVDAAATTTTPKEPKAYILPAEVRNAILSYLMARPYAEVAQGVAALANLTPAGE